MSDRMDALVTVGGAVLAAGTSVGLLYLGAGVTLAGVTGLAVFAIGSQLQAVAARRRDRAAIDRELRALKRADLILSDQLSQAHEQHEAERTRREAEHATREGKLTAEIRMTETLLRQFAESMVKRVQAVEAAQVEVAGQARRLHQRLQHATPAPVPMPEPLGPQAPDPRMLDTIQRALIENRVDLHLQPIVSLPQRKLRFYEAFSRLRTADGTVIMPGQYLRVAEAAGLVSTVDNLLLFRCVQFIRRLTARQRDVGVFCNISMHSLNDAAFFPQFVDFMRAHRDLANQIIFELPQEAFDAMGPGEEASLKTLANLGFAVSMDRITDLAFEPELLRRRGVRYVKVSPHLFLDPDAPTLAGIRKEDFRDLVARYGISVIADKIETERQVVDLLDFSVDYGQGYLFGEPRAPKEDGPEPSRAEARQPASEPTAAQTQAAAQPAGMTALFQARPRRVANG